jgi:hypothetical protein
MNQDFEDKKKEERLVTMKIKKKNRKTQKMSTFKLVLFSYFRV